jgi:hypothetical protein
LERDTRRRPACLSWSLVAGSFVCHRTRSLLACSAGRVSPVSRRSRLVLGNRPPARLNRVHPSLRSLLLQSSFNRNPARYLSVPSANLPGVSVLFAVSPGASTHYGGFQVSATFRPQAFSTSRRLSPHPGSRACFIPQPRQGFLTVLGLLPSHSLTLFLKLLAPLPLLSDSLSVRRRTPRTGSRDFEALLRAK